MNKPTPSAEKSVLLNYTGLTQPRGGSKMKLYVKQMYDWNCYAYYAEDVDEQYWDYFKSDLWWKLGNGFIKSYDNVADFEYCADNFTKYGETFIKQKLKINLAPWEKALSLFIPEMNKLNIDWFIHGSTAMALWGIAVPPRDINISIPNYDDFEKVRNHFYKMAVKPFGYCENWVVGGLGEIFWEAAIGFSCGNKGQELFDMSKLGTTVYNDSEIHISSLEMLKRDNEYFDRPERVSMIQKLIDDRGVK